jgi:ATP-dependent Clp protease protease subunit
MVKSPVHTIVIGKAYSAGAILLAAGDERYALPSSKMMLHGVQYGFPLPGNDIIDNKNYYGFVNQSNETIMKLMAKYTGQPLEKLKQDLSRELWLTASDAVAYGLVDGII